MDQVAAKKPSQDDVAAPPSSQSKAEHRPANPPSRHHYAPRFYLARWANPVDGQLEQFSRPGDREVKARRVAPAATGYEDNLYAMHGLPAHLVQQVEERFMQKVDARASAALELLERGACNGSRERSDWARFILSLSLRTPQDVGALKARTAADWDRTVPELQEQYEALRKATDPDTLEAYLTANDPLIVDRAGVRIMTKLINNTKLGEHLVNMIWCVLDLSRAKLSLLTSDRPVLRLNGLEERHAFLTVPISPTRLFVAANNKAVLDAIAARPPRDLVCLQNRVVVGRAAGYVWGSDRSQLPFIRKRFGTERVDSLGESLANLALGRQTLASIAIDS